MTAQQLLEWKTVNFHKKAAINEEVMKFGVHLQFDFIKVVY